jgi:hypothetical protein
VSKHPTISFALNLSAAAVALADHMAVAQATTGAPPPPPLDRIEDALARWLADLAAEELADVETTYRSNSRAGLALRAAIERTRSERSTTHAHP